jgi:dihydroorotase
MEIVINDTNILIDLFNAGLLEYCKRLNIEFRTLDVVMEEITVEEQKNAINRLVDDGTLTVCTLTGGASSNSL